MPNTAQFTGPRPCMRPGCTGTTQILKPARGYVREYCHTCGDIISSWPAPGNPKIKPPRKAAPGKQP